MQQAINVAARLGRKVAFVGRSIDKKAQISKELGYLNYPEGVVVALRQAVKMPINKVMYIISGSYGQHGSALHRAVLGEHDLLKIKEADVVIFSSDPAPPGSKANVDFVVDKLIEIGADVHYYDIQEDLHVSGHGSQEDIKMLMAITRPKFLIPIGGTVRYMRAYKNIALSMGAGEKDVFELAPGQVVSFKDGSGRVDGQVKVKSVLVDGLGIGDVGNVVLRDRHILAKDGIAIIMLQFDKDGGKLVDTPEIISRGFVYEEKEKGFLKEAGRQLKARIDRRGRMDFHLLRDTAVDFMERYFFSKTGRRPMVLPVVVEV
jgi:ribonuclease J